MVAVPEGAQNPAYSPPSTHLLCPLSVESCAVGGELPGVDLLLLSASVIDRTVSSQAAQRFYDRLGSRHDLAELYEGRAKARALELLQLVPGLRILNAGVGTGKDQTAIARTIGHPEMAVAMDISMVMLNLVRRRAGSAVVRGDVEHLPFGDRSFDRILCTYVLDLIPTRDLPTVLVELKRALRPGGRVVLVSLTDGVSPLSRLLVGAWKTLYRLDPLLLGGCRPLRLRPWLERGGFEVKADEIVLQRAVPSEVVVATVP